MAVGGELGMIERGVRFEDAAAAGVSVVAVMVEQGELLGWDM